MNANWELDSSNKNKTSLRWGAPDVSVKRNAGTFTTSVYRKPTHTDPYTHPFSHHHPSVKSGRVRCLRRKAETVCGDETSREEELAHLRDTFRGNGYPDRGRLSPATSENRQERPWEPCILPPDEEPPTTNLQKLFPPYVQGLSENIQNVCRKMGIPTVFKSRGTFRQLLMNLKTPTPEMNRKEVVYQIPCRDCDSVYIGETGRSLGKRIMERKYAVAVHAWDEGHRVDWEGTKILESEPHYLKRSHLDKEDQQELKCGLWPYFNQTWLPYFE